MLRFNHFKYSLYIYIVLGVWAWKSIASPEFYLISIVEVLLPNFFRVSWQMVIGGIKNSNVRSRSGICWPLRSMVKNDSEEQKKLTLNQEDAYVDTRSPTMEACYVLDGGRLG